MLYNTLSIFAYRDYSLKCMETLATNSEKAALVHFLTVEYTRDNIDKNQRVTSYLSKILIDMHSLSDFRVRSPPFMGLKMLKDLGKILWSVRKILIFSKLMILLAIKSRSFSITNSVLPGLSRHFSNSQESNRIADTWIISPWQSEKHSKKSQRVAQCSITPSSRPYIGMR